MQNFVNSLKRESSYIEAIVKGFFNPDFQDSVVCLDKNDYLHMTPFHYGTENKDKVIYIIHCFSDKYGFFATHRATLLALLFADKCDMVPVVEYGTNFLYSDSKYSHDFDKDPFEYYFKQPSSVSLKSAYKSAKVIHSHPMHVYFMELMLNGKCGTYDTKKNFYIETTKMHKKYIHLNNKTQTYINDSINSIIGGTRVLGVHARGSDFKRKYNIHPIYVTSDEYLKAIKKELMNNSWNKIFLATDDFKMLKVFEKEFGNKLLYYSDVKRTNGQTSVAFTKSKRKYHQYRLGLEVLRDVYTLSSCRGFIAGISQVSICTRIINAIDFPFEFLQIIDKGRYYNSNNFR